MLSQKRQLLLEEIWYDTIPRDIITIVNDYSRAQLYNEDIYDSADNFSWETDYTFGYVDIRGNRIGFKAPAAIFYSTTSRYDKNYCRENLSELLNYLKNGGSNRAFLQKSTFEDVSEVFPVFILNTGVEKWDCHIDNGNFPQECFLLVNPAYLDNIIEELEEVEICGAIEQVNFDGV